MASERDLYLPPAIPGTAVQPHLLGEAGVVEPSPAPLLTRVGAEALGTFGLVLVILGTALWSQVTALGVLGVGVATALALAGLISAFGHVSGGHFNPAVSLGAALAGRVSFVDMLAYWVAQVAGAALASLVLFATFPRGLEDGRETLFGATVNGWGDYSPLSATTGGQFTFDLRAALIIEAVATAVFVAVILGVTGRKAAVASAPFAIGGTLGAMIMVAGLATNAGLNPARSTAAAIVAGGDAWGQLWLFWVAPLVGAAIAGLFAMAFAPVVEELPLEDDFDDDDDDEDDDEDEDDDDATSEVKTEAKPDVKADAKTDAKDKDEDEA